MADFDLEAFKKMTPKERWLAKKYTPEQIAKFQEQLADEDLDDMDYGVPTGMVEEEEEEFVRRRGGDGVLCLQEVEFEAAATRAPPAWLVDALGAGWTVTPPPPRDSSATRSATSACSAADGRRGARLRTRLAARVDGRGQRDAARARRRR
ncbi:hypothetical protein JL721_12336 [Aureococcus anophagefferens]|nr:hypothetical protein JL721_12336 [Aureococcus anophagefferens]